MSKEGRVCVYICHCQFLPFCTVMYQQIPNVHPSYICSSSLKMPLLITTTDQNKYVTLFHIYIVLQIASIFHLLSLWIRVVRYVGRSGCRHFFFILVRS